MLNVDFLLISYDILINRSTGFCRNSTLTTLGNVLVYQAIGDTQLFSLTRKITCSPVILPDGKFVRGGSL